MAQALIVEGNDGIFLSNLCKERGLAPPVGYETPKKFMDERAGFIKQAGGLENVLHTFRQTLNSTSFRQIGIIMDANDAGPLFRCQRIEEIIKKRYPGWQGSCIPSPKGTIIKESNLPVIGVWIMPDNQNNGYLEHFVADLIPEGDALWDHAQMVVAQLPEKRFSGVREQKALLHTWLAWQETPGLPFGTALSSGILTPESLLADRFIEWFKEVFELSSDKG